MTACRHIQHGYGAGMMCKGCADEAVQSLADRLAEAEKRLAERERVCAIKNDALGDLQEKLTKAEKREQDALALLGTLRDLFVSRDSDDYNIIDKTDALLLDRAKVIPGGLARKRDAQ